MIIRATRPIRSLIGAVVAIAALSVADAEAQLCGDADGDGRVEVSDGVNVLRTAAGLPSTCTNRACDPDGSGTTTVTDGVIVLRLVAALPVPGACEDDGCVFGPVTLEENLEIPADVACVLEGTRIEGNVTLAAGSALTATGAFVGGNIQGQEASALDVRDSEIGGDVQFERGGSVSILGSRIDGNLQLEENAGDLLADLNTIGGDLQAFQNVGGLAITFTDNTIGGNLQCKENDPAPAGGGNVVDGNKEDQCAAL